ncbi:hypothetical protein [Acinetobacter haemolyticus]|uniref:Uncharacterized protein n=1 Tax=Acinetobacter haemolyticus TaxID=29430 RepID=A0AAW4JER8_ACIHA|nr:hypothetical protein [Acinetobacter haemolyticus]MBO3658451.1 hypothetical protein [Acinetobacter haemolyticus]
MKELIKTNLGLLFISIITVIYLFFVLGITDLNEYHALKLNEKGDFLAGAFSPLAFLWLVYGYLQQGQELKLNTKALEMQVTELEKSVQSQKDMYNLAKTQYEELIAEKTELAKPKLLLKAHNYLGTQTSQGAYDYRFQVKVENLQIPLINLRITSSFWDINLAGEKIVSNHREIKGLNLDTSKIIDLRLHRDATNVTPFKGETLKFNFENHDGKVYEIEYKIEKNSLGDIVLRHIQPATLNQPS